MLDIPLSTLLFLVALLLVVGALCAFTLRPTRSKRIPLGDIRRVEVTDELVVECPRCRAYRYEHAIACWRCNQPYDDARADAKPTPPEAA